MAIAQSRSFTQDSRALGQLQQIESKAAQYQQLADPQVRVLDLIDERSLKMPIKPQKIGHGDRHVPKD